MLYICISIVDIVGKKNVQVDQNWSVKNRKKKGEEKASPFDVVGYLTHKHKHPPPLSLSLSLSLSLLVKVEES